MRERRQRKPPYDGECVELDNTTSTKVRMISIEYHISPTEQYAIRKMMRNFVFVDQFLQVSNT